MIVTNKEISEFFIWLRNGVAFCTTWFLILMLIYNRFSNIQAVSTDSLIKMILWISGGVLIFCILFSRAILRKLSFLVRLTCFMVLISVYEILVFYWFEFFVTSATVVEWIAFIVIVLVLYLLCISIYHIYSKKRGQIYTQALQEYQKQRSMENGK